MAKKEEEILEEIEAARKYPRVVIELPTSEELLDWLANIEKKGRKQDADKLYKLWQNQFDKWKKHDKKGNPTWGDPSWTEEEAYRRAGAYARGYFHYGKGRENREKTEKELEKKFKENTEKYRKLKDATAKRNFIKNLPDEERALFSAFAHSGRVEARGMDLMKFAGLGVAAEPTPPTAEPTEPPETPPTRPPQPPEQPPVDEPPKKKPKIIIKANIAKVPAEIDGVPGITTYPKEVGPNTDHDIRVVEELIRETKKYKFRKWADGFADPERREHVEEDNLVLIALYQQEEEPPPPPPPPGHDDIHPGNNIILVDSYPMKEVKVDVEMRRERPIQPADIQRFLPPAAATPALIAAIMAVINDYRDAGLDDSQRVEYLDNRLQALGLRNPRALTNFIIQRVGSWESLDAMRNAQVHRTPPGPDPFGIRRMTGTAAGVAANYIGQPQGTPRNYLATYGRNRIDINSFTVFELTLPNGRYRFTAPEKVSIKDAKTENNQTQETTQDAVFERWDIYRGTRWDTPGRPTGPIQENIRSRNEAEREIRSRRTGVQSEWNRVLDLRDIGGHGQENIKIMAIYKASARHERRPELRSPYQLGTSAGAVNAGRYGRRDTAFQAFGAKGFQKGGIDRNREAERAKFGKESGYRNSAVRAAVNKGKRILNQYARAEYSKLFDARDGPIAHAQDRMTHLRQLRRDARAARHVLRSNLQTTRWYQRVRLAGSRNDQDLVNRADEELAANIAAAGVQGARDTLAAFQKAYDEYFKDFKLELESASAQMENHMLERSATVSVQLARRFRMPLNGEDEQEVTAHLRAYALEIAERFVTRGRSGMFAMTRGLENLSRGLQTGSEMTMGLFENTINFIFGPWTITTLFVLLEFFFVLTYIGYNLTYLWIFPLIGAGFTFILNFSDSFRPLDWVTHLASGAIIGYGAMLLLISLGALSWSFMSTFWFWLIWAILGFLGIFQFYQTGGWKVVLQGGVIILIFAYIALGPYSAYYQQALDQVKTPVEIAYRAVSNAIGDVWLLATNPTEWYARQQVVNVRPEHPLDFPKGIEVSMLEALPPSVPGGMEFALTAVIKNEGSIKDPAKDIMISVSCNQWCDSNSAEPTQYIGDPIAIAANRKAYNISGKMERNDALSISIHNFAALSQSNREGETRLAQVLFNLSYRYSTSSSLLTEIMSQPELNRRIQNNENVFRNVIAVAKSSPAQLSLNVGPQPLMAGQRSLLLVSVSNTRDESKVHLPRGTKIIVTMPKSVGSGLQCDNYRSTTDDSEKEIVEYIVPADVNILPYEFRSIFAFICDFTAANVDDVKTDLITAEMPDYTFVLMKKMQIPVTPQIGIIFNPYESTCNKCGQGAFLRCTISDCNGKSNYNTTKGQIGTCWFEFSDMTFRAVPLSYTGGSRCHACGSSTKCERFITPGDCNSESKKCGLSCEWDPSARRPSPIGDVNDALSEGNLDPNSGACKAKVVSGISIAGQCSALPSSYKTGYEKYKDNIATAIDTFGLDTNAGISRADAQALVAAVISQESGWTMKTGDSGTSFGLMQIHLSAHTECSILGDVKSDPVANIKCGVKILSDLAKQYKDQTKTYSCGGKSVDYTGIDLMLRAYNGWGCNGDTDYVNHVKLGSGTNSGGHMNDWLDCFNGVSSTQQTQPTGQATQNQPSSVKGSSNYCSYLYSMGTACDEYQGGCNNQGECLPKAAGLTTQRLDCRLGISNVGICCYPQDSNDLCISNFNAWKSGVTPTITPSKADLMGIGTITGLQSQVQTDFNRMQAAAKQDGINLNIVSGYRRFSNQLSIWNAKITDAENNQHLDEAAAVNYAVQYSAVPGMSRHHWGTEIDINSVNPNDWNSNCVGSNCQGATLAWLTAHASEYGFCQPYNQDRSVVKAETWHWSYKPISEGLTNNHMQLITASDLSGRGIAAFSTIKNNFDYYHNGFISNINDNCK